MIRYCSPLVSKAMTLIELEKRARQGFWASPPRSASFTMITRLRMKNLWGKLWEDDGQDIAEYAIMLAVVLAIVVGTIRLIGSNANNVFSSVASSVQ